MSEEKMTREEFYEAVYDKLHEKGYCDGMDEERIRAGFEENKDIADDHFKSIGKDKYGLKWHIEAAAWNISMCT